MKSRWSLVMLLLLLLGWAATSASGVSSRSLPLVNPRSNGLETASSSAKVAQLRDRSLAALSKALTSQAVAKSSALASEQVQIEAMTTASQLKDLSNQATMQADSAADASREVGKVVEAMETTKQDTIKLARQLAVDRVREMFKDQYQALAGWRETVLQDPHTKAARDGPRAAEPYSRALDVFYSRIQDYQAQAGSLARKSIQAAAEADKVFDAAQAKVKVGDTIGANQDLELARSKRAEAASYADDARALQASAGEMNGQVGLYYSAGQAAAERAAFMANPNGMPALPADPNLAYAPPAAR
mmetsp:Transcript_84572/g.213286  ORF Transcript_84572/g.213286 Transcript_84572/m.213286 type:complete len:302 (-) Transcript_84572:35-940(-)